MSDLQVGQVAPDFEVLTQEGKTVRLADYRGKNVVLYFYPKDDTPGCTLEAQTFRDKAATFAAANTVILGVSRDSVASHQKFCNKYSLEGITLLSDETESVCQAYGVIKEKNMYGKKVLGIERTTFVLDKEGAVAKIYPKVKVDGHADAVLAFVQSMV